LTRVTGVSVVDNKFVVVRGLSERYSNTTLNGADLVSSEPPRLATLQELRAAAGR
jgi:hypothetical protein